MAYLCDKGVEGKKTRPVMVGAERTDVAIHTAVTVYIIDDSDVFPSPGIAKCAVENQGCGMDYDHKEEAEECCKDEKDN